MQNNIWNRAAFNILHEPSEQLFIVWIISSARSVWRSVFNTM